MERHAHQQMLISNGYIRVMATDTIPADPSQAATILSNIAYYGYVLSPDATRAVFKLSGDDLVTFWKEVRTALLAVTGSDKNMGSFVVYKNFPREVLDMSESQYWVNQICMYLGCPNEWFTEPAEPRPLMNELGTLKVLALETQDTSANIYRSLVVQSSRWTDNQKQWALDLLPANCNTVAIDDFGFRENGVIAAHHALGLDMYVTTTIATDVLRIAAALSGGDVSLRTKVTFARFKRPLRRKLLGMLNETTSSMIDDFMLRPEQWKRLLSILHPGDFYVPRVHEAYDLLYRKAHQSYASKVEHGLLTRDLDTINLLATRPGDFARRLHTTYAAFGNDAFIKFVEVMPRLTTAQLLKLHGYFMTINTRKTLMYPPKGSWSRAKVVENTKVAIDPAHRDTMLTAICDEIKARLNKINPNGFDVSMDTVLVNLPTNDQELAPYGRGTVFPIPENMTFVRTASYWENKSSGHTWFDNGWNFFDKDWKPMGSCCWLQTREVDGAVFSGDPTNAKELKGRACQMIDLHLKTLAERGIRYAVWNILCYSGVKFNDATDVLGTLQWGEDQFTGQVFEPNRAQMVFPLKGDSLTKYVAYIDIENRTLVYMDANLAGSVRDAGANSGKLSQTMPAFVEYMRSLPSVYSLFSPAHGGTTPVMYTDANVSITGDAYVFSRQNPANEFNNIDLVRIMDGT